MLEAAIAAIAVAAAIVALCVVLYRRWAEKHGVRSGTVDDVRQVSTFGVGTSVIDDPDAAPTADELRVGGRETTDKPADSMTRRFLALAGLSTGVFAVLAAKLWQMQVLSGQQYAEDAHENLFTDVATPAPRGCIYDASGTALVLNRLSQTVLADGDVAGNSDVVRRLSAVLGVPAPIVRKRIADAASGAQSQRVVASDVTLRDVAFITEHFEAFPGVGIETRTVREYPYGALAAHALGYTGAPSEEQLERAEEGRSILATDTIGMSGIESYYDGLLSGDHGSRRVMTDAMGNIVNVVSETAPLKGSDVYLELNAQAQYTADRLLAETIAPAGDIGTGKGVSGAVVALDVRNGGVKVMASYPTFDPTSFTGGIPEDVWALYNTEESHAPLNNRAINGQYAAASTYKAFTSMAGLEYGFADDEMEWECTGSWDGFGTGAPQKCWARYGHGMLGLRSGIVQSCDVVFYEIAKQFFLHGPEGSGELTETALQEYIGKYNFGKATGIDLDNESEGRIPTPAWKAEQWRNVPSEALWVGGDYSNMIIGQGDVLVTPLQVACGYMGIATGKILKPHLLKEVRNTNDEVVVQVEPEVIAEPEVNQAHLAFVRDALRGVITENSTVARAFGAAGIEAAGKSGTAEHTDRPDDAWFVAYAPFDDPHYVCACVLEQGGGGSDSAGPIVAQVLGTLLDTEAGNEAALARVAGSSGKAVEVEFTGPTGRTD